MKQKQIHIEDNSILQSVLGASNRNLSYLSKHWEVKADFKDQTIILSSVSKQKLDTAVAILQKIIQDAKHHIELDEWYFEKLLKFQTQDPHHQLQTYTNKIFAKSPRQDMLISLMQQKTIVFCTGVAGTGKTYLSVLFGLSQLKSGNVNRLILSRPAVEAGENLGFLPGDLQEKVDPYMRPIYDALSDGMDQDAVHKHIESGVIEIAPLAFMRGRTLSNAFILLDEAQNTTPLQMEMFLTRLGANSKMVIVGDLTQGDLPIRVSGMKHALSLLQGIDDIGFMHLTAQDVIRHPLVAKIVEAYGKAQKNDHDNH